MKASTWLYTVFASFNYFRCYCLGVTFLITKNFYLHPLSGQRIPYKHFAATAQRSKPLPAMCELFYLNYFGHQLFVQTDYQDDRKSYLGK